MKEVKQPKKPLLYYYSIVLAVLLVFNIFVAPLLTAREVEEVDYGRFMSMMESQDIGLVEVQSNQIVFSDKAQEHFFKTGRMDDPQLVDRLYESRGQICHGN